MSTPNKITPPRAEEVAKQLLDMLLGHEHENQFELRAGFSKPHEVKRINLQKQLTVIKDAFNHGIAKEKTPGAFAAAVSEAVRLQSGEKPVMRTSWISPDIQELAYEHLGKDLHELVNDAIHPKGYTNAKVLAKRVLDVLHHDEVTAAMMANGTPKFVVDGMRSGMRGQLQEIEQTFRTEAATDPHFATNVTHELKTAFVKNGGALRDTWADPGLQERAREILGPELHGLIQRAAHPVATVPFAKPVEPSTVIKLPEAAHEQAFVANMSKAIVEHGVQLDLNAASALGATPIRNVAQSKVNEHYKAALKSYNDGLEVALDKRLFHDSAMLELENTIKANPSHRAALQNPQIHEAIKQHLGEDIAAKIHAIAPARPFDARHIQDFAAKLKTGLEAHEEHFRLAGASAEVMRGTEAVVADHYKAAAESFSKGLKGASDVKAYHAEVSATIAQMVQDHPQTKATLLNPVVKESLDKHVGYGIADFVQNAAHPEIAREAAEAAKAAEVAAAKTTAEAAVAAAKAEAAALKKAASKMTGGAKWAVAGLGLAVGLGTLLYMDNRKSHATSVRNRETNPLLDQALAR